MMKFAVAFDGPIALRYPRGEACEEFEENRDPVVLGKAEVLKEGEEIALLAVGSMVKTAERVRQRLEKLDIKATLVNMRFVKPFDTRLLKKLAGNHDRFVTLEENVETGGFGQRLAAWAGLHLLSADVLSVAIPDQFVTHGSVDYLYKTLEMDDESVCERILKKWYGKK